MKGDLKKLAEDIPIVRIVDTLLKHAILQRASDIHIEPMEKEVLVRYRIDGILHDAMVYPKTPPRHHRQDKDIIQSQDRRKALTSRRPVQD